MTKAGSVCIIGKPNVGKSTLMNSALGTKLSIVTSKPQTTRKRVLGIYTDEQMQAIFLDTPGIISPKYELHNMMMSYVREAIDEADTIAVMLDVKAWEKSREFISDKHLSLIRKSSVPKILILNKIDLLDEAKFVLPIIEEFGKSGIWDEIIPMSAINEANVDEFLKVLQKNLPESPFFYDPDILSTHPERFFVGEIIRESVFEIFKQEVPYSTEVLIGEFKERASGKWFISAEIVVERDTQKAIIIGKNGAKIKQLGLEAREKIEEHLGLEVYLDLFVKVRDKWRSKPNMLKSYGY